MALPSYSIVIDDTGTATAYDTPAEAQAAFDALLLTVGKAFLYLDPIASKERAIETWEGTYVDSYGVTRTIGTNEPV